MKHFLQKLLVICFIAGGWVSANAQDPSEGVTEMGDTLLITATYDGSILNALNKWILWDHDGDYANAPKHTVYKLLRNKVYIIQTTTNINGRLAIVADKPDLNNKPPQIIPMNDGANAFPWRMFAGGPFTFKNIYFTAMNASTNSNDSWQVLMQLKAADAATYIDGCYFENINAHTLQVKNDGNKIYMTNNFFSDGGTGAPAIWQGNFFNSEAFMCDSLIIKNNTYINTPGLLINVRQQMTRYAEVSNNTMINTGGYPFFTTFWVNAVIKNNLFYNVLSRGEDEKERAAQDPDGEPFSMINMDTLYGEFTMKDTTWYERESERSLVVKNNYYGWDDEIEAIWASRDSVFAPQWMNERTLGFFADDTNYPLIEEMDNSTKADIGIPTFETPIPTTPDFVKWIDEGLWGNPQAPYLRFVWEPTGATIPNYDLDWPPLEDLRITKSAFVGDDGLPLGDQNWYAERAVRWDMTGWGRETNSSKAIDKVVNTLQSYPNPFTNSTTIAFDLEKESTVQVTIYSPSGQVVRSLVSENKAAGSHTVTWNGKSESGQDLPKGIYFIRLKTDTYMLANRVLKVN